MEQQNEQEENNEVPGLSLGIDFGNSKISAAIWDIKRKEPSIVSIDGKNQFPSTLYFKSEITKKKFMRLLKITLLKKKKQLI